MSKIHFGKCYDCKKKKATIIFTYGYKKLQSKHLCKKCLNKGKEK